jgi:hypothetical protein
MRNLSIVTVFFIAAVLMATSCKKETVMTPSKDPLAVRKIQFSLYTDKDFSGENNNVLFTLTIQNYRFQSLWDSTLPPIKLEDIPDAAHKLIATKSISVNDTARLRVGFIYSIENVGHSSFFDSSEPGDTLKMVDFNFQ